MPGPEPERPPCGHQPAWSQGLFLVGGRFLTGRCCPVCGLIDRESLHAANHVSFTYTFTPVGAKANVHYGGAVPQPPPPKRTSICPNCGFGPVRISATGVRCRRCGYFRATQEQPVAMDPNTLLDEPYTPPDGE